MKHIYVEGIAIEVTAERAAEMLLSGLWYECEHQHTLPEKYTDAYCITVYHKTPLRVVWGTKG